MQSSSDVVIIGAGVTGLTAAYLAARNRSTVTVLDPGGAGGVIRTVHQEGFTRECGPNVLLEKPEFSRLIDMLGIRGEMVFPAVRSYRQFVWYGGRMHAVPKSPTRMLTSGLLSVREKAGALRALVGAGVWRRGEDEESVADFFGRALGETVVRRIMDPALKGIYGGSVDSLSAAALFPGVWDWAVGRGRLVSYLRARRRARGPHARIFVFRPGMEFLCRTLIEQSGARLTIERERAVSVEKTPNGFRTATSAGSIESKEIWITSSGAASAGICAKLLPELSPPLGTLRYAALAVAHCAVPNSAPLPPRSFGVLFPSGTPGFLLGVMFNSLLFPHLAPPGQQLLTVCLGGAEQGADSVLQLNDKQLRELVFDALERYLGVTGARMLGSERWPRAIPQYEAGTAERIRLMDESERRFPGLHFAGADRGGVGVPDRVRCVFERMVE